MIITNYIKEKTNLKTEDELSNNSYKMFNTGGVECEVGEFLYGLVRILKCKSILETGTHFGISTSYMGLAMKHNNNGGKLTTIDPMYWDEAKNIFSKLELNDIVNQKTIHTEKFETDDIYDLILLDTEPMLRFSEFGKFFENLKDGGIIIIHDLHPHLSYGSENVDHPDYKHWPYGDFRSIIGKYIKNLDVQTFSFETPRGITIFQKKSNNMSYVKYLKDEL